MERLLRVRVHQTFSPSLLNSIPNGKHKHRRHKTLDSAQAISSMTTTENEHMTELIQMNMAAAKKPSPMVKLKRKSSPPPLGSLANFGKRANVAKETNAHTYMNDFNG